MAEILTVCGRLTGYGRDYGKRGINTYLRPSQGPAQAGSSFGIWAFRFRLRFMNFTALQKRLPRMFERLPRQLMPALVILLAVLRGSAVRMRCQVVQLGRPLMIFVMRSAIVSTGH